MLLFAVISMHGTSFLRTFPTFLLTSDSTISSYVDWDLTPRQVQERNRLLALGGICPWMRTYSGGVSEVATFLRNYALYWPRHLGFENLTIIFDDESSADHLEAALAASTYPFLHVGFEVLPTNIPAEVIFPANIMPGRPGYDRQIYSHPTSRHVLYVVRG